MKALRRFHAGERVLVHVAIDERGEGHPLTSPRIGRVHRIRMSDGAAWVRLDERVELPAGLHPFAAGDARGCDVIAFPESCEAAPWAKAPKAEDERGG